MQNARNLLRIFDRLSLIKHRRYFGTLYFPNDFRGLNVFYFNGKALAQPCSAFRTLHFSYRCRNFASAQAIPAEKEAEENPSTSEYHSIITDKEKTAGGPSERHQFQAETKMLLDIVAKSLYSEKEVFARELISNASDALEKLRYIQSSSTLILPSDALKVQRSPLEIHLATDKAARTFTIQDTGVGMTHDELIENLGTIARSGSKAFLKELQAKGATTDSIIGQFGVGFYSAFMVADRVEVFTKSYKHGSKGYRWASDGSGQYEITEAENVQQGTKIVCHLKAGEAVDFADERRIEDVIRKYSNFVTAPIFLNGKRVNAVQAIWTMDPKNVSAEQHDEFYRFISHHQHDRARYCLHYKADAPINIRALLYVPEMKPTLFDLAQSAEIGVSLYSRRVLIQQKTTNILPKWMRFMKGVIDSEDIPLNLSRELLQQTALIAKLKTVLTGKVLKFLQEQHKRDPGKYEQFFTDYGVFLKEGIISTADQQEREDLAKCLLFESSNHRAGVKITLLDYCTRLQAGQRDLYYLCAPSRSLAESSPYFEAVKEKNLEVLFCYEPYDELLMIQLQQFDRKHLTSVEKQLWRDKSTTTTGPENELKPLSDWIKATLGQKVNEIKVTNKLTNYPCMVTVEEMGAARHFIRTQFAQLPEDQRYLLLKPTLELNPSHPIIEKLNALREKKPDVAKLLLEQIYDNAMVTAGLLEDPRTMMTRLNELLAKLLMLDEQNKQR